MAKTTTNDVRVIEGWITDPFGKRRDWYDHDCENIHPSAVVDPASLVIGDKAMPMAQVEAMLRDAHMIARTVAALQMSKEERVAIVDHDFAHIAAKYGITL